MPSQSCAVSSLELLRGRTDALALELTDGSLQPNEYGSDVATHYEIAAPSLHDKVIDGRTSRGLNLDDEKDYRVFFSKRDLLKFLDKNLSNGTTFAVIYQITMGDAGHAVLISNAPIVFGNDYRIKSYVKKCRGRDKVQAKKRF
jgi:hypothetical protein